MKSLRGRIIKGIGGFYSVERRHKVYVCRPRGKFRVKDETPLGGRHGGIHGPHGHAGRLSSRDTGAQKRAFAAPRRQYRPYSDSNSFADPEPDFMLVDKMMINAVMMGTQSVICINKYDLTGKRHAQETAKQYKGHRTIVVSAKKSRGIKKIIKLCKGKTVCFAGQSGTGKTSLLNEIMPERTMEVGEVSKKTKRGRHTTRHAELVPFMGGYLVDTPGFSLLELPLMEPNELQRYYEEFRKYEGLCRFKTCRHESEPGCAVLEAVESGGISKERHERYCEILKEAEDKWRKRYG